jgi:cytochrome c
MPLFNSKSRLYFNPNIPLIFLAAGLSCCTARDAEPWQNEKVEGKRFAKVKLAEGFDEPMEMAITPERKVIVVERKGTVKLFSPSTNIARQIATMPVYFGQEDGLLGVALDPQYSSNHFVYFYYSPNDNKPRQRVSRFVLKDDSLHFASEKVIIEIPTQREECCHSAGSLAFGPDGNLFIAVGDNTNPHNPGYYNSIDERKGRANWDAQRTAANTNDLRGKVLCIHPEPDGTYTIPDGNLFPKGTAGTRPEIYAMGCRNPFRITLDLKRGWLFWGDVGQNTIDDPKRGPISYDEWNVAKEAGFYGWPYFAGPNAPYADFDFATEKIGPFFNAAHPLNESVNNSGVKDLPPAKEALIWYSYDSSKLFKYLGTGGKSPIAGPVYYSDHFKGKVNDTTRQLPAYYDGKLFIAEWMRDWINVVTLTKDGKVDSIEPFIPDTKFNHPIDLELGPDGVLYVLEYGTYWFAKNKDAGLYRIEYNRGNRAPVAKLAADKSSGGLPLTVQFSAAGSFDPDSAQLTYKWYFDKHEVQSTKAAPTFTFQRAGNYKVRLVASDKEGKSTEQTIEIKAGNAPPEITLNVDGNRSFYWSNTPIRYALNVEDNEDGSLQAGTIPAQAVNVTVAYHAMGPDLTMVAQAHEATTSVHPGFALMEKSDCKSCHALKEKSVGPSYWTIAERYRKEPKTLKKLAAKVIAGGSGVWGEHAMSAHPQLSTAQATQMVSYILSVKNEQKHSNAVAPSGIITPDNRNGNGQYILSVTYEDKPRVGVGANLVKKQFHFRYPQLNAADADDDHAVAKQGGSAVKFTESGSWLLFKNLDLTQIAAASFSVDPTQIGGKLSLRLDKPDGKEICNVAIAQISRPQKKGADQKNNEWLTVTGKLLPVRGVHDVYVVYENPRDAQAGIWQTLLLNWITFKKQ